MFSYYAHIEIADTFLAVTFFVFLVITRHHGCFEGCQVETHLLGLPELCKSFRDLENLNESKLFRTEISENSTGTSLIIPYIFLFGGAHPRGGKDRMDLLRSSTTTVDGKKNPPRVLGHKS